MTPKEREALHDARPEVPATFVPMEGHTELVRMLTPKGCPYLGRELDGTATCTVHAVRPYQCRRFMCGRTDLTTEPFEMGGPLGCRNLTRRLETGYEFVQFYRAAERRAQREWAEPMGWHPRMR